MGSFDKIAFTKVPREQNSHADALARIGFATEEEIMAASRLVQELTEPSIVRANQVACIEEGQGCSK